MASPRNRLIRIAGASGSASDRRHAFTTLAKNHPSDPIDVIIGDWMSEANMTSLATRKSTPLPVPAGTEAAIIAYEPTFLEALSPALKDIHKYGIKVAVNAGGSDTFALYNEVLKMLDLQGLKGKLKVAWIEGDDVLSVIQERLSAESARGKGGEWDTICTDEDLYSWPFRDEIIGAQAYLGGMGIATAFREGADIVVAGRVSDASPVIGAAAWWHAWDRERDLQGLAGAFVAGHLVECSTYVCGGNWCGFQSLEGMEKGWFDIGYPIAEIGSRGEVVITKQKGTGGVVNVETCKAQLLYEIQGPWYFNSDVTAVLDEIQFQQVAVDRVSVSGVKALPPPPTTKIGITARGGYQAEIHWFLVGLDIEAKARMLEAQIRDALSTPDLKRFSKLEFKLNGTAKEDAEDQNAATVDFRIFAQARNEADIAPGRFLRPVIDLIMCSYPGATFHLDFRQGLPKPVQEYFVALLSQDDLHQKVHLYDGRTMEIEAPKATKTFPRQQPSFDTSITAKGDFGETVRGPLGWIVQARSGDKGSDANVGFWVKYQDEYDWMRDLLSIGKLKELLAKEYKGGKIDRFELPNIWAVHFLLRDHLDRGVSCTSTLDFLAKNVAEFLRNRYVDIPKKFLNRGKL